ncbi:MAG: tRNA pseudouridine(38-40) synthase TruA [Burkholderiales bacterium]
MPERGQRLALGVSYGGEAYQGWQSQRSGCTVQDRLEAALTQFACEPIATRCAGRTDAGVHALMQVVHFDTARQRSAASWIRGTNRYLPSDIAVQWAQPVPSAFHARGSARSRRYGYRLLESPVRPSVETGKVGWSFRTLDGPAMEAAAARLVGEHDFTSFRAAACQAASPVKTLHSIRLLARGSAGARYWWFEFEANAFLHHMIRNIMGCLIAIGHGAKPVAWIDTVLSARDRAVAAPTFSAAGLYFLGPVYEAHWGLPQQTAAYHWIA